MRTELRFAKHTIRNCAVVEIWCDGKFVGQIVPLANSPGFRVLSKHLDPDDTEYIPLSEAGGIKCFDFVFTELGKLLDE